MSCVTDIVVAASTFGSLFVAGWGLKVLIGYARDTKTLASASQEQLAASQRPFISLTIRQGTDGVRWWALVNQGFGPAINIRASSLNLQDEVEMMLIDPLMHGGFFNLEAKTHQKSRVDALLKSQPFVINYESLNGEKCVTTFDGKNVTFSHSYSHASITH